MDCKDVHIVLCDQDPDSGSKILVLLQRCSYRVTAVKNARDVITAVESVNSDVDIVLSDVELPHGKGFKMLKYLMRKDELNHIPVVVMSARDEMAVVAKCLQLGAVDYLVKPLRLNEVMNLWTHMWRRRRMLGLPEKHAVMNILQLSCPSSGRSTDSLSGSRDNSNGKYPKDHLGGETSSKLELSLRSPATCDAQWNPAGHSTPTCPPLKQIVGRRSAFTAYSKPNNPQSSEQSANMCSSSASIRLARTVSEKSENELRNSTCRTYRTAETFYHATNDARMVSEDKVDDTENLSGYVPNSFEQMPSVETNGHQNFNGFAMSPSGYRCRTDARESPEAECSVVPSIQQPSFYNKMNVPESTSSVHSYYSVGQMVLPQFMAFSGWPTMLGTAHSAGSKTLQTERREAALNKFRMKRKGRCFEKKIRYVNRKKIAEQRPRIRGQFVRRTALSDLEKNKVAETPCLDEGEGDDEQDCSELDSNSPPECMDEFS